MSKLAVLAFGAALTIAPAQTNVPADPADQRPTTPTTGPNTTGTPAMGATLPQQSGEDRPAAPRKTVVTPRGDHETGTPVAGSAVSGPVTVPENSAAGAAAAGPVRPAGTAATASRTTGHIPATTARPASTAATHSGSTPVTADQSDVRTGSADRTMPDTAAGWLGLALAGSALSGAGIALRRRAVRP